MNDNKTKGDFGENAACLYLMNEGYNITARNFRAKTGEIDIIAENDERLAFAEVKTRKLFGMGRPADAVDFKKKNRIIKTAQIYLMREPTEKQVGFDIIEIVITESIKPDVIEINHFENAFDASGSNFLFV